MTAALATPSRPADLVARRARRRLAACLTALAVLALVAVASLVLGVRDLDPATVWQALTTPVTGDVDHQVVRGQRVPRTLIGLAAGLALGVAGTLIQGVTRNPIADPGLLGLNAGASLAVVCAVWLLGVTSPLGFVWFAFLGAAVAAALVFSIGAGQPVKLALVGATVTALITPLITIVLLRDPTAFNMYRFWAVGSLTGRGLETIERLWPFLLVGVVVAGTATALAGPIALVGLAVPHAARRLVGTDYRWVVALSALLGPVMLLGADVIGRLILPHSELEAGVVAAALGAPVLVAVARGRTVAGV